MCDDDELYEEDDSSISERKWEERRDDEAMDAAEACPHSGYEPMTPEDCPQCLREEVARFEAVIEKRDQQIVAAENALIRLGDLVKAAIESAIRDRGRR